MAISNPVTIGQNVPAAGTAATVAFTTVAAVPVGGKTRIWVAWVGAGITLTSLSPSNVPKWTIGFQTEVSNLHLALVYADCPLGIPSGTVITAFFSSAGADSRFIAGEYNTGEAFGLHILSSNATNASTAWSSGAITVPTGDMLHGANFGGGFDATNTPTGGNTEIHDFLLASDSMLTTCYQAGSGSSIAAQGTLTNSVTNISLCVSFTGGAFDPTAVTFEELSKWPKRAPH